MTAYRYVIYNKYGEPLDLSNPKFAADLPDVKRNYTMIPRLEQGGSVLQGDGQIQGRKLPLKFDYVGSGDTIQDKINDVYHILNVLGAFFRKADAPFYAYNLDRNVRARVISDFDPKHMAGMEYLFLKNSRLDMDMLDSAWEDSDATVTAPTVLGEDGEMELDLPIYSEDVFPIIDILAGSDSPKIFSISTGSGDFQIFRYALINELTFTPGAKITIDSVAGRMYINGNLNMDMLTGGFFPKFDRRNKKLRFNSSTGLGSVTVTITYRKRSLYG